MSVDAWEEIKAYRGPVLGFVGGYLGATALRLIGVTTGIHEIVGHVFLGGYLMRHYTESNKPTWQIDGWDNFKAIFRADSASGGAKALWHFVSGHDSNRDGAGGKAWVSGGTPNRLAESMGPDGLSAWTSLSGSIPDMVINNAAAVGGIHLIERAPTLAATLIGFSLANHILASSYAITAALMSAKELTDTAKTGHDFANFALRMGKITGMEATRVAQITAALWTLELPALTLYTLLTKYSHPIYCVSDERATQSLIQQGKEGPFTAYELDQARGELYSNWKKGRGSPRLYRVLKWFTFGRLTISIVAKYGGILSLSAFPGFAPYANFLKGLVPLMGTVAIFAQGARWYADYNAPEEMVTQKAKWISGLDFAFTTGVALGLFSGLYGNLPKTFALSLIASVLKPVLISQLRLREERTAFEKSDLTKTLLPDDTAA